MSRTAMRTELGARRAAVLRHRVRDQADRLLTLAEHLPPDEQMLIEQFLAGSHPVSHMARLYNQPRQRLHRRIRQLLRRLQSPLFRFVAHHPELIPRHARATARQVVLHGKSLRTAARDTGLSLHRVRQHMHAVRLIAHTFDGRSPVA